MCFSVTMFSTVLLSQIILTLFCQAFCFEPTEEDLKCFNDYETEMKCSLSTDRLKSCSGYKLNITHTVFNMFQKMYACMFERSNHSDNCECKIKVQGFVVTEIFTTTLLEGTNTIPNRDIKTEISKTVPNTVVSFEIMGKNLQPNTNYILTATISTDYNDHSISSDQSAPVEFTTSLSPDEIAKMVIPPLCVGLIIIICVIFICILRMKMNWWDKISKPKIDANLGEEKGHILPPSVMKFSPIHVEIPTLDLHEDKKWTCRMFSTFLKCQIILALICHAFCYVSFEITGKNLQPNTNYILTATMSTDYNDHSISSDQSAPVEFTTSSSPDEIAKMVIPPLCFGLIIIICVIFICILRMKMNWWDKISKPKIDANHGEEKGHILPPSVIKFFPIHVEIPTLDLHEDKKLISALSVDTNDEKCSHSVESAPVDYGQACSGSPEENISTSNIVSRVEHALDKIFQLHPITNNPSPLSPYNQVTTSRSYKSVTGISSSRECNCANRDSGNQTFQGLTKSTEGQWSTCVSTEQALNACGALKFPQSTGQDPTSVQQISWATSLHFPPVIQIDSSYQCV
ncbi:uncharacterized protein LOC107703316 [Sinocyclocheilus anshuiensis]|uniref:uncharacterized protein LOC107703316 n=1 Tax=Sinocyclocheilus anshuiensis TaxID=1608454 RepID=UPI0007B95FCE|nr:PREDICTED: uncharacterized protein LOC107703316 [Sinocyclocheilus anshuiensis]